MLSEPKISYKPFWGICRPLNSWRANSPNPIQIYCALKSANKKGTQSTLIASTLFTTMNILRYTTNI